MHAYHVSVQDEDSRQKPKLSYLKLVGLTISFLGVQFGWAIQMAFTTPIFLELGVSHLAISFIWLAGPISGLVVQPIVGAVSDSWFTRFGRRSPFIFVGGICIVVGLALISNATLISKLFHNPHTTAILIAIIGFWVLDLSNNTVQGPCRALLVDVAPQDQQAIGSALFSFMLGMGNLMGYFTGYLNLIEYFPFMGTQYRALFTISMIILAICLTITLISTKEIGIPTTGKIQNPFKTILVGIAKMPVEVSRVCAVQFFSWIAWFTFILFITDWVGENIFHGDPFAEQGSDAKKRFDDGVRHGALALGCNAVLTIFASAALPKIVQRLGIKVVWFTSQMILAACLILTQFVHTVYGAITLILVCGIPWAVTMILPFAIVGEAVPESESGLYMGALNIFVVIPQILVSLFIPFVIALFDKNVGAALVTGGVASIIAALFTFRLISPVRIEQIEDSSVQIHPLSPSPHHPHAAEITPLLSSRPTPPTTFLYPSPSTAP